MKYIIAILITLLILLQFKLWLGDGGISDVWRLNKSIQVQNQENIILKERNLALEAEVQDLKQGMNAIEERARNELGMIRKGETFYQVVEE